MGEGGASFIGTVVVIDVGTLGRLGQAQADAWWLLPQLTQRRVLLVH